MSGFSGTRQLAILTLFVIGGVFVGNCAEVLTYHNDNGRTGLNPDETILTPATVNVSNFGLLFSHAVDGDVYGQPLYLSQITIAKGVHNVVFVVTQHDSVYAFDADSNAGRNASPLWQATFLHPPEIVTVAAPGDTSCECSRNCTGISPEIGISSTPVIDPSTLTIYVVSTTKENNINFVQRLHALDAGSGAEKFGGPIVIAETISENPAVGQFLYARGPVVPGSGESNKGDNEVFYNALRQSQRSGLALVNGVVYIASASNCDCPPYHGWLLGFDATTLKLVSVFNTTPNATSIDCARLAAGGIWGAGGAPAADAQNFVYVTTGNGVFDTTFQTNGFPKLGNFGDSVLKVAVDPTSSAAKPNQNGWGLKVTDFFTPFDQISLWTNDSDLGSGGLVVLPNQTNQPAELMVQADKQGTIYLINRESLGKYNAANNNQIIQSLPGAIGGCWSTPAFFNDTVYYNAVNDVMKAFKLSNGQLSPTPVAQSDTRFGYPGATPSVSGAGADAIVWALETDQYGSGGPAILHAYRADNLQEIYNSGMAANNRDQPPGSAIKFCIPTVVNGKVYVGARQSVSVFGRL